MVNGKTGSHANVINGKVMVFLKDGVRIQVPFKAVGTSSEVDTQLKNSVDGFKESYPEGKLIAYTDDGDVEKNMSEVEAIMITRDDSDEILCADFTNGNKEATVSYE